MDDLFHAARSAVDNFVGEMSLDPKEVETTSEIKTRLIRLEPQYVQLMSLNQSLRESDPLRVDNHFDPDTGMLTMRMSGEIVTQLKLNRADPNIPIKMEESTSTSAYVAGRIEGDEPANVRELKAQMESGLEDFYQNAHRVLKLALTLPGAKRIKAKGVNRVRNKLIEHPPKGALYTFGWSDRGPRVKPMHRGELEWNDDGLEPNTAEFLNEIVRCFTVDGGSGA